MSSTEGSFALASPAGESAFCVRADVIRGLIDDESGRIRALMANTDTNALALVRRVVQELQTAGFRPLLFGGWAEELHGIIGQRRHHDIDLLVVDPVLDHLDQFLAQQAEIVAKRFSHKRAYVVEGVLVELFLVERSADGYTTTFFGLRRWQWPDLAAPVTVTGLALAPTDALAMYRANHAAINAGRPAL